MSFWQKNEFFETSLNQTLEIARKTISSNMNLDNDMRLEVYGGREHMRSMARSRNQSIEFPYMAATIDNIEINTTEYHQKMMYYHGVCGPGDENKNVARFWHMRPLFVSLGVLFLSQDYRQTLQFIETWHKGSAAIHFSLESKDGMSVAVRVDTNNEIRAPDLEMGEIGANFQLETQMTVHTYSVDIEEIPLIKKIKLNTNQYIPNKGEAGTTVYTDNNENTYYISKLGEKIPVEDKDFISRLDSTTFEPKDIKTIDKFYGWRYDV